MKVLLFGADGQVGFELLRTLGTAAPDRMQIEPATRDGRLLAGRPSLAADLGDPAAIQRAIELSKPDLIINAAAYTQVDRAEDDPQTAHLINAVAPGVIAKLAREHAIGLIHYSTDYVFSGDASEAYREQDPTAPLGVYGASKLAGERAVLKLHPGAIILRTCWVYGWRGNNFLLTMLRLGASGKKLKVVADQVGSPTSAAAIAQMTGQLIEQLNNLGKSSGAGLDHPNLAHPNHGGVYHLACAGHCSWFEFAQAIFAAAKERGLIPAIPEVSAIPTSEYPTPASRPQWSVLDCSKLQSSFAINPPAWQEALADCLDRLAAGNGAAAVATTD